MLNEMKTLEGRKLKKTLALMTSENLGHWKRWTEPKTVYKGGQ